jgi:hypothetical protein
MMIYTLGDFRKATEHLSDDFKIELRARKEIPEEQLLKMRYPYPFETFYSKGFNFDDVGYSDKDVCIGVEIPKEF